MTTEEYLFGDSDLAARRLAVLAEGFAASSRAFMVDASERGLPLAVDLGCGPGTTTHLLADALECDRAVGLDNAEHFITLAEKTATPNVSFRRHDVTTVPFPDGLCDLIYARFLLTHLPGPEALVAKWATQLRPGGRLLLEEAVSIDTTSAVFSTYLTIAEAMLTDRGHDLYVGRVLDTMALPGALAKRASRVARVALTNSLAAKLFWMNMQTWKHHAFVRENYSPTAIQQVERGLADLAATPTEEKDIEWRLLQLVLERKD